MNMPVQWKYSPEMLASMKPLTPEQRQREADELKARSAESMARIEANIRAEQESAQK